MQIYSTVVKAKKELNPHMIELTLEKPQNFVFTSGQFVQFLIPDGTKIIPRAYSICSIETDREIRFCIKIVENGVGSTFVTNIQIGDAINIKGPQGRFICSQGNNPLLFVATGAGMAPIISHIRHQLEIEKSARPIHLIFGVRNEEDLFWQEELNLLRHRHHNIHIDTTLSHAPLHWAGLSGRVTLHIPDISTDTQAFLCGSPPMVQEVRKILLEKGLDAKHIHFEIF